MKKVLIVSYMFSPLNIIASKRYGIMCKYFEEFGYRPYVLTTHHDRNCGVDVRLDLELPIDEKYVIRIGNMKTDSSIKSTYGNLIVQMLENQKIDSRTITRSSIGWYEKVKNEIELDNLYDNIDIIIGTFPPMENLFVAKYLSKKLRCPYIADVRDLISDYTETGKEYKRSFLVDKTLEKYMLSATQGIVTVTPGFRDILRKRYPNKLYKVIFNGWEKSKEKEFKVRDKYLYYAGSLYMHRLESFALLVRCIKKVNLTSENKIKFVVRSIGPKELNVKAKKLIQREGADEYVSILEAAPENVVKKEQNSAFINVVLSTIHKDDVALMTTIPGKVYELLNENVPILAVVPNTSDVGKVLGYTNKGIASISEKDIIKFILKTNNKYKGNANIEYFSRRRQAKRLCKFMDEVLKKEHEKNNGCIWDKT